MIYTSHIATIARKLHAQLDAPEDYTEVQVFKAVAAWMRKFRDAMLHDPGYYLLGPSPQLPYFHDFLQQQKETTP